jgi:adenosine deaminase
MQEREHAVTRDMEVIRSLPKVELHRHLAGCMTPEIIWEMKRKFGAPAPGDSVEDIRNHVEVTQPRESLNAVLQCFRVFRGLFVSPEAVQYAAYRVVEDAARDGIRYLELRFSPGFTGCAHKLDQSAVFEAVVRGSQEAAHDCGMVVPLIAISSREMGPAVCLETCRLASSFKPHVVAVDLAGNEDDFPPELFVDAFEYAHAQGLRATVHAGEQGHADNVRKAVELLHADRIGHGIQIIHRPDLMELVSERDVPLEICITSNWIVSAVPTVFDHPVCRLAAAGVPVVVNSDDPALFHITLSGELALFKRLCGLSVGDLVRHEVDALDYGFAPEREKGRVRQALYDWWNGRC